ncbi:hypothetical protein E2562_027497 [Oryza meyeriana var. granulata]|uniref:Uncharacterized protein n=1 Tax=Oryza meyeriana var. granulata TaxID=110450 RepID=A0A6G1E311_9ORYZ|nr:hypothetical protein E2562_027497 [Oryza meyeriana var. granulata]
MAASDMVGRWMPPSSAAAWPVGLDLSDDGPKKRCINMRKSSTPCPSPWKPHHLWLPPAPPTSMVPPDPQHQVRPVLMMPTADVERGVKIRRGNNQPDLPGGGEDNGWMSPPGPPVLCPSPLTLGLPCTGADSSSGRPPPSRPPWSFAMPDAVHRLI